MPREQQLAAAFVELADTLRDDFAVLSFLQGLAERATQILRASAAGVVLSDQRGDLQEVASTSHAARVLGVIALSLSLGPAQEAFDTGEPVVNVPAAEAVARWPRFVDAAADLGFRSVHAFPLRYRNEVVGALSVLYSEPTRLGDDDAVVGAALARVAAIGLVQERTPRQRELVAERLQAALTERVELEQAKGVVAELTDETTERAFELMLAHARTERRKLSEVVRRVLDGSLEVRSLLR